MPVTQLATNQYVSTSQTFGDVKHGIQSADHNGWVKLDGRLKSTLTASQQTQATALGIGTNLPDASNSFLVQNGTALGSVSGSNTKTIAQNQLPDVTLGGTTSSNGGHSHTFGVYGGTFSDGAGAASLHTPFGLEETRSTSSVSNHSHNITTASINGGVTQQTFDVRPQQLSVNVFLYLGN